MVQSTVSNFVEQLHIGTQSSVCTRNCFVNFEKGNMQLCINISNIIAVICTIKALIL